MDTQITKRSEPDQLDDRDKKIIAFIYENKKVTRSKITEYSGKKFANKRTVDNRVKKLLELNILKEYQENPNSRNKYLVINNDNVILKTRIELEKIHDLFLQFLDKFLNIYTKPYRDWPNSSTRAIDLKYARDIIHEIIHIPIAIINIISKIFDYREIMVWSKYDDESFKSLHFLTFLVIGEMKFPAIHCRKKLVLEEYQYDSKVIIPDDDFVAINNRYDKYKIQEKIPLLRHRCKAMGLLNEFDNLINYIISENREYLGRIFPPMSHSYGIPLNIPMRNPDKKTILHNFFCPGIKSKKCDLLDLDPIASVS